jgi:N utilization substance protein A
MSAMTAPAPLEGLRPVLDDLAAVTGAGAAELVALVERAVADTYARLHPGEDRVIARFNPEAGTVLLTRAGEDGEIETVPQAGELLRQSALAVRTAVTALVRETERTRTIREGSARRGELVDAIVERQDGELWWLRVDGLAAVLPPEEQVPGEVLERNHHLKVVVVEVRRRPRDAALVVSRARRELLRRLLEQEVPELSSGQVVIRALVREPGRRSKVAVDAPLGLIDAEGACIGPKGVRIRAVVAELGEEQVHVVGWSADPGTFVARALGPAQVSGVELDEETHTAHVTVPDAQLSLAIGRSGENARLAARLTGWRVDIRGEGVQ